MPPRSQPLSVNSVVVHYGELSLKGRNRPWFVSILVRTIKAALHGLDVQSVKPLVGRLVVTLGPHGGAQWDEIRTRLSRIPGIGNFALATHVAPDLELIAETVAQAVASEPAPRSFRIAARRADKRFGIPSPEIERVVGARVQAATGWKVDLSAPELAIGIEVLSADAFFYFKKRSKAMREFLDRVLLKFPIIGPIMYKSAVARFARTLSTMFAAGVPLVEALESVAGACGNIVFENAVLKMRDEVATGQRLQRAMENTGLFPNMVIQMIAVGEEAGALDAMSGKVATFYEAEVDNAVDSMSSLLEPLIMAILGVLVGGLVIAMYLPIFKLGAVV